MGLKAINFKALNRYLGPQGMHDLNLFLERLPQHAGQSLLIAAGVSWAVAAGVGLFTFMQARDLSELRAQLQDANALKPLVPVVREMPLEDKTLSDFSDKLSEIYKTLEIRSQGNKITINSTSTASYGLFREAVSHVFNGGNGWKVSLDSLCVGRECKQNALSITLKINRISIDKPESVPVSYAPGKSSDQPSTP